MAPRKKKRGNNSKSKINRIKSSINKKINSTASKVIKHAIRASGTRISGGNSIKRIQRSAPPPVNSRDKDKPQPKFDIGKGRLVYPQKGNDGKVKYLPRESGASKDELKKGLFIKMEKKPAKEVARDMDRKYDIGKGRFIYPVKGNNEEITYLPKESEASKIEKENGQFVADTEIIQKVEPNLKAKFDVGKGRYVFPVKGADNEINYLPKKDDATDSELSAGLFVKNEDGEKLEPTEERRIRRAKPKSAAKPQPPAKDAQGRRNLKTRPIPEATDDTPLWDSENIPLVDIDKVSELLKPLKAKYDIGKGRMIYPVENDNGEVSYLPLKYDASDKEIKTGLYADIVPPDDMQKIIRDSLQKKEIDVEGGIIKAITEKDIKDALNSAPKLILRMHKTIIEKIKDEPLLEQEWV